MAREDVDVDAFEDPDDVDQEEVGVKAGWVAFLVEGFVVANKSSVTNP